MKNKDKEELCVMYDKIGDEYRYYIATKKIIDGMECIKYETGSIGSLHDANKILEDIKRMNKKYDKSN